MLYNCRERKRDETNCCRLFQGGKITSQISHSVFGTSFRMGILFVDGWTKKGFCRPLFEKTTSDVSGHKRASTKSPLFCHTQRHLDRVSRDEEKSMFSEEKVQDCCFFPTLFQPLKVQLICISGARSCSTKIFLARSIFQCQRPLKCNVVFSFFFLDDKWVNGESHRQEINQYLFFLSLCCSGDKLYRSLETITEERKKIFPNNFPLFFFFRAVDRFLGNCGP